MAMLFGRKPNGSAVLQRSRFSRTSLHKHRVAEERCSEPDHPAVERRSAGYERGHRATGEQFLLAKRATNRSVTGAEESRLADAGALAKPQPDTIPWRMANFVRSELFRNSSFPRIFSRCASTVFTLKPRASAISRFVWPEASSRSTWNSRSVNTSTGSGVWPST